VEEASFFIGDLFYSSFGQPAPAFPVNYVAFFRTAPSVFKAIGYIHMTERGEYGLVGGLCVEVDYRHRKLGETLLRNVEKDVGEKKALFVQTNNPSLAGRVGYQPTKIQYLMVKWVKPLSEEEQEKMIHEVAQVGPF
jgi:N-acetylglutamate synthase-like GNAT family acetyltransferase